jgi:hypothetical protein
VLIGWIVYKNIWGHNGRYAQDCPAARGAKLHAGDAGIWKSVTLDYLTESSTMTAPADSARHKAFHVNRRGSRSRYFARSTEPPRTAWPLSEFPQGPRNLTRWTIYHRRGLQSSSSMCFISSNRGRRSKGSDFNSPGLQLDCQERRSSV